MGNLPPRIAVWFWRAYRYPPCSAGSTPCWSRSENAMHASSRMPSIAEPTWLHVRTVALLMTRSAHWQSLTRCWEIGISRVASELLCVVTPKEATVGCFYNGPSRRRGRLTGVGVTVPRCARRRNLMERYGYDLTPERALVGGRFDISAAGTVKPTLAAALESEDWESAVRAVICLGGDTATLACITGAIAEAIHGIPAVGRCSSEPSYRRWRRAALVELGTLAG